MELGKKLPAKCKGCGFESSPCNCMRCTSVRASGFCCRDHEETYYAEKDLAIQRILDHRRTA